MTEQTPDRIEGFADGYVINAEGYRTAILVCRTCGAAVMLHRTIDTPALHRQWHREATDD